MTYFTYPGLCLQPTVDDSIAIVEELTGIPVAVIQKQGRKLATVMARCLLIHLLRTRVGLSVAETAAIAYPRNKDNRNSVMHMEKLHNDLSDTNILYRNIVKQTYQLYGRSSSSGEGKLSPSSSTAEP